MLELPFSRDYQITSLLKSEKMEIDSPCLVLTPCWATPHRTPLPDTEYQKALLIVVFWAWERDTPCHGPPLPSKTLLNNESTSFPRLWCEVLLVELFQNLEVLIEDTHKEETTRHMTEQCCYYFISLSHPQANHNITLYSYCSINRNNDWDQ
jgi:hypothetical protein